MFIDRFRDVDRKGQESVRQAAATLDTFVDDADEARAAVQSLEVHHRMEHPLARADHFLVELPELVGRAGRKDIGQCEVGYVAAVGQGEELVEAATGMQDAPLEVAEDDEVGRILDERAGEAHTGTRREDRGAVDLRVFGEDEPDLAIELRIGLQDDLSGADRFAGVEVTDLEHPAPGRPAGGGVEQGGGGQAVLEFEEELVDVHARLDLLADRAVDERVGKKDLTLAAADQEGPGKEVG